VEGDRPLVDRAVDLGRAVEELARQRRAHHALGLVDGREDLGQRTAVLEDRALLHDQIGALLAHDRPGLVAVEGQHVESVHETLLVDCPCSYPVERGNTRGTGLVDRRTTVGRVAR
jgi:hypothetical protein